MIDFNKISTGIEYVGNTVKTLNVENNIADIEKEAKRIIGFYINEPFFKKKDNELYAQLKIDFSIEIEQSDGSKCTIEFSIEGLFAATDNVSEETFQRLVAINGASALIGIARGKIEAITGNIFNNGKIVIPFVNVLEYYKSMRS